MSNSLLTINDITREALRLFRNSNAFIQNVDMQYDSSFAVNGAKIGTQLRIRLPNDYVVRTGAAASIQDTNEQSTTLVVATQQGVDVSFNSVDRTMSLMDYSKRILAPMINNLAGAVALNVMTGSEGGVANMSVNLDAAGNILTPVNTTFLLAGAILDTNSAPRMNRRMVVEDPFTEARVVAGLAGLLNPGRKISEQYDTGQMMRALGFDWMSDQTVLKHTSGTFTAGTVNGASQTGTTVVTNAITGTLVAGDIITFASVNGVNRVTKQDTGALRQFVVTAAAANGATSLSIYPAIIPAVGGVAVQFQTTTISPANGATILLVGPANTTYRKNIALFPEAVTMATADLELPEGVWERSRVNFDNISMRSVTQYWGQTDQTVTRLDVLYGYLYMRPEWAVVVPDII